MRRLALLSALLLIASALRAEDAEGVWHGALLLKEGVRLRALPLTVTLDGVGSGTAFYPSLGCKHSLGLVDEAEGDLLFEGSALMEGGDCLREGLFRLQKDGRLSFHGPEEGSPAKTLGVLIPRPRDMRRAAAASVREFYKRSFKPGLETQSNDIDADETAYMASLESYKTDCTGHGVPTHLYADCVARRRELDARRRQQSLWIDRYNRVILSFQVRMAVLGDPEYQLRVGRRYAEGELLPKDPERALAWTLAAAAQGYAPAQRRLGMIYASGEGVEMRHPLVAKRWLLRAALQGDDEARAALADLYENQYYDAEKAKRWREAAQ